jgi:thymidylate kinase
MWLVAVVGAAPGIGKSRLCVSLVDWLTDAGLAVDHFAEEHVLNRPAFAAVAAEFGATGRVSPTVLVDATARYLADAAAAGTAVVVMDSLIPFVPSLLAFGHTEHDIAGIVDDLASRIATFPTVTVFLDGDAATALPRAAAREGNDWLAWYTDKLARYGLLADPEPDLTAVCEYLSHERATTLRVLRRQSWNLVIIEHADTSPHEQVFHTARQAVAALITDPAPTRSTRSTPN